MNTYTPSSWTGAKKNDDMPRITEYSNEPFYLMHNPLQWELIATDDGFEWLPCFSQLNEGAGVNGVVQTRNGVDSSHARVKFMEKGFQILDREFGYITRYPTKHGGWYYSLIWDVPKIIANQTFWNHDSSGYNQFRKNLVLTGVIERPEPEVIELKIRQIDRRIDRRLKNQHIPEIKKEIDKLYELKKQMKDAFDSLFEPVDEKSTKKKGAK